MAGDLLFWGKDTAEILAQNARTGHIVWTWRGRGHGLGGANGSPAAYVMNGREYVVMPFGGNKRVRVEYPGMSSPPGDALIAFALPDGRDRPHVVIAHPIQVPVKAPAPRAGTALPPPNATTVELKTHDYHYYPHTFRVRAGSRVAVHIINVGDVDVSFAVDLPGGAIGLAAPVKPHGDDYFTLTAPTRPGTYAFFSALQIEKYVGMTGTMDVTSG